MTPYHAMLSSLAPRITAARRRLGLTQSELARRVGCRQSAVSMLERGNGHALARPKVEALLAALDLETALPSEEASGDSPARGHRYCPVYDCPSNLPFAVKDTPMALPDPRLRPEPGGRHCALCGELLEDRCPECGADINRGACCRQCGTPYVTVPADAAGGGSPHAWAAARLAFLRDLLESAALRPDYGPEAGTTSAF